MINKKKRIGDLVLVILAISCIVGLIMNLFFTNIFCLENVCEKIAETTDISIVSNDKPSHNEKYIYGNFERKEGNYALIEEFENIKFIENKEYFLNNPKQHKNDPALNSRGVCTTIAMQMLMGYHNYYSDRRIIPKEFLSSNYGDLNSFPSEENQKMAPGRGDETIGTADSFFMELFNLTTWPELPGLGQNIPAIVNAANRFVKKYSAEEIKENITIKDEVFSAETARQYIDNNLPIVLGFQPVFTGADSFHVVPAYGYATFEGEQGFLVHCGWGDAVTLAWVPESWFGFQITMNVRHEHCMEDGLDNYGIDDNELPSYRKKHCKICGVSCLDKLYKISEDGTLLNANYELYDEINVPEYLYGTKITKIKENAFKNQKNLNAINFEGEIISLGDNAFNGCTSLKSIDGLYNLQYVGQSAFKDCVELTTISMPALNYLGESAFENCSKLESVKIGKNLNVIEKRTFCNTALTSFTIPANVVDIKDEAFLNTNITSFVGNANYTWENNVLIKNNVTDQSQKVAIYVNPTCSDIFMPSSVAIINAKLFKNNSKINTVDLNQVKYIGPEAFSNSTLVNIINSENIIDCDITALQDTPWYENNKGEYII